MPWAGAGAVAVGTFALLKASGCAARSRRRRLSNLGNFLGAPQTFRCFEASFILNARGEKGGKSHISLRRIYYTTRPFLVDTVCIYVSFLKTEAEDEPSKKLANNCNIQINAFSKAGPYLATVVSTETLNSAADVVRRFGRLLAF